jgi:hypothetical protein
MSSPPRLGLAIAVAAVIVAASPAHAAELCGWLIETTEADSVHQFDLWLEADADVSFFYKMSGKGIVTEGMKAYSPGSGTFSLSPKRAQRAWGFGSTLDPPGDVDIVAEIHVPPKSVFSDDETPLLAKFTFQRHVPEDEKVPPKDFAKHQCATIPGGR